MYIIKVENFGEYEIQGMKGYKRLAKVLLIRESDGKVAVQIRSDDKEVGPGCIDFSAGGKIDEGETPVDAAVRELYEEIRVKTKLELLDRLEYPRASGNYEIFVYLGKIDKNIEWFDTFEVKEVRYLSLDEILDLYRRTKTTLKRFSTTRWSPHLKDRA